MSSRDCQSGWTAAEARADRAEQMWGGEPGGWPSICSTRGGEPELEARKAAGACREALRKLKPPRLLGRLAFSHYQSDRGPPTMDSRDSRMAESKSTVV